uniref:Magnesium transporter MgtE intracellular domain-containing protein n=1 Tax=Chaetoceros debilis TaxID=122233 RepID=A0A7S3QAY8_9STRA|mmetsp:Transcript_9938/g.14981  ORF Transcript_9938/g.14981 Transcript_9938/m.14981 type:complete len:227 (-) Transcript_9938:55-735(-)|eukprot:CAMPEP_0194078496 /NCGR_PEP_ID=MMETSP0149-20130528/4873_1 /TAXON_ID=122233 /ORGANISM="Chaetoceros debilis, Strain MM31A-1" /LENGTH=226 /DNA_ID=CAMNT_0038759771 /DNA_START=84 /DNA_END=764 /DNA_ORIENTATION=-
MKGIIFRNLNFQRIVELLFVMLMLLVMSANAFDMKKHSISIQEEENNDKDILTSSSLENSHSHSLRDDEMIDIDFTDPELLEAIQMFSEMSLDEIKEIFGDDPEALKEIEEVMEEISKLDPSEIEESMKALMEEELIASAMTDTLEMLAAADADAATDTDEQDWDKILENKDVILEAVIASGSMSEEDIALFLKDGDAWEEELSGIWNELKEVVQPDIAGHGHGEL